MSCSEFLFSWFSTREIASIIYIFLFLIIVICRKSIRTGFLEVIKCALKIKLIIPFIVLIVYSMSLFFALSDYEFWNDIFIKDIIMWTILVGVPFCFNAVSNENIDDKYFIRLFFESVKFTVILEFFIGTFTFKLWVELIVLPVVTLVAILHAFAATREEWKLAYKFLDFMSSVIGIVIIICTIKSALGMYKNVEPLDTMISFLIPIVLSILFIPWAYLFAMYSRYEILFIKMGFREPPKLKTRLYRRFKVIVNCGISYKRICFFSKEYVSKMFINMSDTDFDKIVNDFRMKYNNRLTNAFKKRERKNEKREKILYW